MLFNQRFKNYDHMVTYVQTFLANTKIKTVKHPINRFRPLKNLKKTFSEKWGSRNTLRIFTLLSFKAENRGQFLGFDFGISFSISDSVSP